MDRTDGLLNTAFEQIRHYSASDIAVSLRLLRALDDIASTCNDARIVESLVARGRRILSGCAERLGPEQVAMIRQRLRPLEDRIKRTEAGGAREAGTGPRSRITPQSNLEFDSNFHELVGRILRYAAGL